MVTLISNSVAETMQLGQRWGEQASCGWIVALKGDLGAGKTHLTKGIALGLGITQKVQSPTFNLIHEYPGGRWPLFHVDLYRLESRDAVMQAGLEDYLTDPRGITVVEWAERWFDWPTKPNPPPRPGRASLRLVELEAVERSEHQRRIRYEDISL